MYANKYIDIKTEVNYNIFKFNGFGRPISKHTRTCFFSWSKVIQPTFAGNCQVRP